MHLGVLGVSLLLFLDSTAFEGGSSVSHETQPVAAAATGCVYHVNVPFVMWARACDPVSDHVTKGAVQLPPKESERSHHYIQI